jgi:hypothetical protein
VERTTEAQLSTGILILKYDHYSRSLALCNRWPLSVSVTEFPVFSAAESWSTWGGFGGPLISHNLFSSGPGELSGVSRRKTSSLRRIPVPDRQTPAAASDATDRRLLSDCIPRSSTYHPDWVIANGMGSNTLWLTEWLCSAMSHRFLDQRV